MSAAPEKIRLFNEQARVEGGALVGSWTDDLPADMVPEAERIYDRSDVAARYKHQRDQAVTALRQIVAATVSVAPKYGSGREFADVICRKAERAIAECGEEEAKREGE